MTLTPIQQFVLDLANGKGKQTRGGLYNQNSFGHLPSLDAFVDYVTQVQGAVSLALEGLSHKPVEYRNTKAHLEPLLVPDPVDPKLTRALELAQKHHLDVDAPLIQALMEALSQ